MQLAEGTFLVTGAASGLGAACVRRFVSQGAKVLVADINEQAGKALADELGPAVHFVRTDVTSEADVQAALATCASQLGTLRGAVNCAGVLDGARVVGRAGPHELERFVRVIQINLIGTFNVLRLAANAMVGNASDDTGERGVIITTSSVAAFEGQVGQAAYSASKGGVASMTLPVARELAKHGIRVVSIAPGVFHTAMVDALPEKARASLEAQTVFPKRLGQPLEYAMLAQQIIENPMLNGSVVRLDGALRMERK